MGAAPRLIPKTTGCSGGRFVGGPLDVSRESAELRELRSFESETFPRAGLRDSLTRPPDPSGLRGGSGPDALPDGSAHAAAGATGDAAA
jgi:hypothetical protein